MREAQGLRCFGVAGMSAVSCLAWGRVLGAKQQYERLKQRLHQSSLMPNTVLEMRRGSKAWTLSH